MRRHLITTAVGLCLATALLSAQSGASPVREPFKLGSFEMDGGTRVGIVLRDAIVIEVAAANEAFERDPSHPRVLVPSDMRALIAAYEYGVQKRFYEIVNWTIDDDRLAVDRRPSWVRDVTRVKTLAPILYPTKMLNAAQNYYGHVSETSSPDEQKRAADQRRRDRGAPYVFLKPTVGAIIGNGDDIVLPRGRDRIDWECELGIVIGKSAKYVTAAQAKDHIFGYTIQLDMSDRGGRPEKQPKFGGSDWFLQKGHDTFAPMGPWIVPKEFYGDPMNVGQRLSVNGRVMQDSRSTDMVHNIYELIEYGSWVMTLFPGDVIAGGSPAGTGMSRSVRPEQIFLKAGDKIVASIEGIGTLTHAVVAEKGAPRTPVQP